MADDSPASRPGGRGRPGTGGGSGGGDRTSALVERLFQDAAGALELYTVYIGERLGRYRALAARGPATSSELAERTGPLGFPEPLRGSKLDTRDSSSNSSRSRSPRWRGTITATSAYRSPGGRVAAPLPALPGQADALPVDPAQVVVGEDARAAAGAAGAGPGAGAGARTGATRPGSAGAQAVVARPCLRVREHAVGLADLLEALLGARVLVDVGVQAAGQPAVGGLQLLLRRRRGDAEHLA